MAHVYLDLSNRRKQPGTAARWQSRIAWLTDHPAIDLIATWPTSTTIAVWKNRESATIEFDSRGISYRCSSGNPLGIEPFEHLPDSAIYERTAESSYPDSIAQLGSLVLAERAGDVAATLMGRRYTRDGALRNDSL